MDTTNFVPTSIDFLQEGMVVPHDIYNANGSLLLLRGGSELSVTNITAIRRYNDGENTIRVSPETYKLLMQQRPADKNAGWESLEESAGYAAAKQKFSVMYAQIERTETVSGQLAQEALAEIREILETKRPDLIIDLINAGALAPISDYFMRHSVNVGLLNGLIGKWMGLPVEEIDLLMQVGLLHDCGKALLPGRILYAPRPLSAVEFEVIKTHPLNGFNLLGDFPEAVRKGVRDHHERLNGGGYPGAGAGMAIGWQARITAVSDIYAAMTSNRAYNAPQSPFHAMAALSRMRQTELEPSVVDVFINNMCKDLTGKTFMLSIAATGTIHSIDPDDLEYPNIKISDRVVKTNAKLFCKHMHF